MKVTTFCKIGVTFGAAALLAGTFVAPAHADPTSGFGTLVGLGSDTTQDVANGLATAIGGGRLASYDAIGSGAPTVITRPGGIAIPRASGSGAGRDMLRVATGQIATATVAASSGPTQQIGANVVGQVDFARSSSGPSSTDQSGEGVLAYIPFARDAVAVAVDPAGKLADVPFFVGSGTDASTAPSLYNIYRGNVQYVYLNADNSYNSAGKTEAAKPVGTTAFKIQPLLPKFGSGTRSYFLGQLGFTGADVDATGWVAAHPDSQVKDTFVPVGGTTTAIEEHDGTAIATASANLAPDTFAVGPFSVGQYVAQNNAVNGLADRRKGVTLPLLGKTAAARLAATTGTGTAIAPNSAYAAMVRDVYNIVPSRLADDPTSNIAKMFVGTGSLVCSQTSTIQAYGFIPMTGTADRACGYPLLRAYSASASSTTVSVPSAVVVGDSVVATATVTSNGNGGGTVRFMNGATVLGTAAVASGSTRANTSITASTAGALAVKAVFVPTLGAVASSTSAESIVTVNAAAVPNSEPTQTASPSPEPTQSPVSTSSPVPTQSPTASAAPPVVVQPTVSAVAVIAPKLTVGKAAKVTVAVSGASVGGTVSLKDGATVLGSSAVAAGSTGVFVTFTPKKVSHTLSATFTPASAAALPSASAPVTVKAAKGAAKITVSKIKAIKVGKTAKVTVRVAGAVTPTGTVTIKEGKKTLSSKAKLVKGKVIVSIKKLNKASHKLTVTYSGSSVWKVAKKTGSVIKVS